MTPAQNGMTIRVALGQEVTAEMFPWPAQPKSTDPAVLEPGVSPMYIACRPPGTACTEPPMTFVAHERGTAQIVAHRDMCGEARRCVPPADWTDVRVTIVVG
ncbi:MAG: hypothetical protein ACJ786_34415 [Catenulispora sp.]